MCIIFTTLSIFILYVNNKNKKYCRPSSTLAGWSTVFGWCVVGWQLCELVIGLLHFKAKKIVKSGTNTELSYEIKQSKPLPNPFKSIQASSNGPISLGVLLHFQ